MNAPFSQYLNGIAPGLKELVGLLRRRYEYVSVLATDSVGFRVSVSQQSKAVNRENMTTERGVVVRVCCGGLYSEAAFTGFDPADSAGTAEKLTRELDAQMEMLQAAGVQPYATGVLPDEPCTLLAEMETGRLPEEEDLTALVTRLSALSDQGMGKDEKLLDCMIHVSSTHISKMFLTERRDMRQSYVYSDGSVMTVGLKGERNEMSYTGFSGRKGPELFDEGLEEKLTDTIRVLNELLDSDKVVPGEYEIIASPEITGLIAHEAFGHGVEMDMFVKGRALGADYLGKRVGSDKVTMHEGALCAVDVTSYAFDDEGTLAGDVMEIENGILRTGICDALSALRLGVAPTGNGKRECFSHKAYTRMTNTVFDAGEDTLEDMIASVKMGYLLEGVKSGMEDPKHWGIQCIIERGYEIVDGKLTGKVVSPLVMTGYVPDLLGSISMVSRDWEVFGSGYCGKGHKEWVKVADGGPYLKAKARLG